MVSKVFNRLVHVLEKCGFFADLQYELRFFQSNADLVAVVSDRNAGAFNRSGATQAVTLDIFKAFDRVCHAYLLHRLKSCEISGQIFGHVLSLFSNIRLQVTKDGTFSQ